MPRPVRLADTRIVSRYDFVLINRTQMIAAAVAGRQDELATIATEAVIQEPEPETEPGT